jgi:hypothetical protein
MRWRRRGRIRIIITRVEIREEGRRGGRVLSCKSYKGSP